MFENHFKIYVLLKDKIPFESELEKQQIAYYCDVENQPISDNRIRYFLLDSDRAKLDAIFTETGIVGHIESLPIADYRDEKKALKLYLKVAAIVLGLLLLVALFDYLVK